MKKLLALILVLVFVCGGAFAETYTDKDTVRAVQEALNAAGFNCGTPDGVAGKKTFTAITEFQAANGLEQTGVIDDALLKALGLWEGYEGEIMFQNIPWGVSPDDAYDMLYGKGIIDPNYFASTNYVCFLPGDVTALCDYARIPTLDSDDYGQYRYERPVVVIGGYVPEDMRLLFLYTPENGAVNEENAQLAALCLGYDFDWDEVPTMMNEFIDKLSAVYGKAHLIEQPFEGYDMGGAVWYGDNNTAVCAYYDWNIGTLNVLYGKTDVYKTIAEIEAIWAASPAAPAVPDIGF